VASVIHGAFPEFGLALRQTGGVTYGSRFLEPDWRGVKKLVVHQPNPDLLPFNANLLEPKFVQPSRNSGNNLRMSSARLLICQI